jgi:hypothetical protein
VTLRAPAMCGAQRGRRAASGDAAGIDDADVVRLLGLLHVVGRQEDGESVIAAEAPDRRPHGNSARRIEAAVGSSRAGSPARAARSRDVGAAALAGSRPYGGREASRSTRFVSSARRTKRARGTRAQRAGADSHAR